MNLQKECANRKIGQTVASLSGAGQVIVFGPYTNGEYIKALRFSLTAYQSASRYIPVTIKAFSAPPKNATQFAANGRPLDGLTGVFNLACPRYIVDTTVPDHVIHVQIDVPVSHIADGHEPYLACQIGSDLISVDIHGSVFVVPGHSDAHDREE